MSVCRKIILSVLFANTPLQARSGLLTHLISYLGSSCHQQICRCANRVFLHLQPNGAELKVTRKPLHEAEELVMMKGRTEEITTLVIKDNGPLEMGTDISRYTLY